MTRRDDDNPFDDIFEQIDEMMRRMMGDMGSFEDRRGEDGDGFDVWGYSMTKRPGEEPEVNRFGNAGPEDFVGKTGGGDYGYRQAGDSSTHVDVIDEDDKVRVIADLPGVEKEEIDLGVTHRVLKIRASNEQRSYDERVELPSDVDKESATASYNNGVLEVELEKQEGTSTKNIDIE
ncbi:MAG: archaeal heat shock protein Hsp20 [Halobacteria archaeon]|nr:archaeal heat shock protein Hsp20 [Halobacteria archaeon]